MLIQESIPVGPKTTMRIGGQARYYGDILTKEDVEEAVRFAWEKNIPLIVLGGGSNTIFADGMIDALVVRIKYDAMTVGGNRVTVGAGKILASLLNDLAAHDLDLSPLTGIPGMVGGAVFGNAGQGPGGIWINHYIETVTAFIEGRWQILSTEECYFRYRESYFKDQGTSNKQPATSPVIWEVALTAPSKPTEEVKAEIERLIKKRIETQPHIKTAGSCFKALPDGTPAWKLIDAAGLRGLRIGGIEVAQKHANFLLNVEKGSFTDVLAITGKIRTAMPQIAGIEMRLYAENGRIAA